MVTKCWNVTILSNPSILYILNKLNYAAYYLMMRFAPLMNMRFAPLMNMRFAPLMNMRFAPLMNILLIKKCKMTSIDVCIC